MAQTMESNVAPAHPTAAELRGMTIKIKTKKGEKNIKRTPCMAEGTIDYILSWKQLLMFKVVISTIYYGTTVTFK